MHKVTVATEATLRGTRMTWVSNQVFHSLYRLKKQTAVVNISMRQGKAGIEYGGDDASNSNLFKGKVSDYVFSIDDVVDCNERHHSTLKNV